MRRENYARRWSAEQEGGKNRSKKVKSGKIMQGEGVWNRKGERIEVKRFKSGKIVQGEEVQNRKEKIIEL